MCGITGIITQYPISIRNELLSRLKRLEYRGYDSVGYATKEGTFEKSIGAISSFIENISDDIESTIAISHTRWATHGGVTQQNAHPHTSSTGAISIVHNGIIENFQEFREELKKKGHIFNTQTDSEVIAHFFEDALKSMEIKQACQLFMQKAQGTFAILLIRKGVEELVALKRDSPLALGLCEKKYILASDIYAFSDETNDAIFFEDNEFAIIKNDSFEFFDQNGASLTKESTKFEWQQEETSMENFDHYMIKEIKEQPVTSARFISSFSTTQDKNFHKLADLIKAHKKIVFVACGTSYHASLIGSILLTKMGFNARSIIASEIENFVRFDKDTLIIAISQSGETMDVVTVLKHAKAQGANVASVVNVPFSTIQRLSEVSIETLAGQEICVAATKTFTNQVIAMLEIAHRLGYDTHLPEIPRRIQQTIALNEEKTKELALKLALKRDIFVLGKGISYPMAREIALKLKEIPYIHAEGMMGGELKHGTIALIENETPVISLIPNKNSDMVSASKEVEARGAHVITIVNHEKGTSFADDFIVPSSCDAEFAIYAGIIGHLLSYYIAVELGREIDKPRNLAKSVTVH